MANKAKADVSTSVEASNAVDTAAPVVNAEAPKAARRVSKNVVIIPEERDYYATLVNATRARAEGSDADYIRVGLRLYSATGSKTVSVFVNEKFFEKTGLDNIVTLENNRLAPCCVDKPVIATIIDVPVDDNTYGYMDRSTGEVCEYQVKGQRILLSLSGKDTSEVIDMDTERRDTMYQNTLFAYIKLMKAQNQSVPDPSF